MHEKTQSSNSQTEFLTGIAVGHTTAWLEAFAERTEIPFEVLAGRVGGFLHRPQGREVLGTKHRMPTLRRSAAELPKRKRKVAVAVRASSSKPQVTKSHMSDKARRKLSRLAKRRWREAKAAGRNLVTGKSLAA